MILQKSELFFRFKLTYAGFLACISAWDGTISFPLMHWTIHIDFIVALAVIYRLEDLAEGSDPGDGLYHRAFSDPDPECDGS